MKLFRNFLHLIVSNPFVYDIVQNFFGFKKICTFLSPYLRDTDNQLVLDVGAGTGNFVPLLSPTATHIWFDCDKSKWEGFNAKYPGNLAVLGSGAEISFKDKCVDVSLCSAIAHHLTDDQIKKLFKEISRVTKNKIIFFEPLADDNSFIRKTSWKYDRGSCPRTKEELCDLIKGSFDIKQMCDYSVYHKYILVIGTPRLNSAKINHFKNKV